MSLLKKKFNSNIAIKLLIGLIFLLSGLAGLFFSFYEYRNVNLNGEYSDIQITQNLHSPLSFVEQLANDPEAGKKIFMEFCTNCHGKNPVIEISAPQINNKKAWASLRKIGIDTLLKITINGVGAMPARGGCFECSDDQLRQTIQYMLKESNVSSG